MLELLEAKNKTHILSKKLPVDLDNRLYSMIHLIGGSFTAPNGDEVSAIAVQDLQITIHPRYTVNLGSGQGEVEVTDPRHRIGSMLVNKIELKKIYRLENVGTPAVIAQLDVPGLPENDVDAWTEVIIPELPAYWQSPTTSLTSYLTMT